MLKRNKKKEKEQVIAQKPQKRRLPLLKYSNMIISVLLLLIITVAILGYNYVMSDRIKYRNDITNLASRQGVLVHTLAESIMDVEILYSQEKQLTENIQLRLEDIQSTTKLFDETLSIFINGGDISNTNGENIKIEKTTDKFAFTSLENAQGLWKPYKRLIDSFITSAKSESKFNIEATDFAAQYARIFNNRLSREIQDFGSFNSKLSSQHSKSVELFQIISFIIVALLFLYVVFGALRGLLRADAEVEASRRETEDILNTVQEGLFLISPDLVVGQQTSKKLDKILPVRQVKGRPFDQVISSLISETDLTNTNRFLKLLFKKKTKESLVDDLNPLRKVKLTLEHDALFEEKYLNFHFSRVYKDKEIDKVLASVTDITESVVLQQQLESERELNEVRTEMLMKVLVIDQTMLDSFLRNTRMIADNINNVLKSDVTGSKNLRTKVDKIFREFHSLKGEASALELDTFVSIAEEAEDKLGVLRNKTKLAGNDLLSIAVSLDSVISSCNLIESIKERLTGYAKLDNGSNISQSNLAAHSESQSASNYGSAIVTQMQKFSEQVAERNNKQTQVHIHGFESSELSVDLLDKLKEISIQLIRNAITHGIESPDARVAKNKSEEGKIIINLKQIEDKWYLVVEDDGKGIDIEKVKEKLRHHPNYAGKDIDSLPANEIYKGLFLPGLTTVDSAQQDAGRGEGMSIIIERLKALNNGKLSIKSEKDEFCRFVIAFNENN